MIFQMLRDWASLERSQWWSREALHNIQERKLSKIVRHGYQNVPFYRRLYDSVHVNPTDVIGYGGLGRLPFVTRQHLRDTSLQDMTAANADLTKCSPDTTSGSTGTPVTLLEDPSFAAKQEMAHLRAYWANGVRPGHKICTVWAMRASQSPLAGKLGLYSVIEGKFHRRVWGTDDIHDHMKFYSVWKPDVLIASPSYYRALLWFSEQNRAKLSFKVAVSSGELLDDTTRRRICDAFQSEVIDTYGLMEVGIVSWECPQHRGYHVNAESVLVEFIKDGAPAASGEAGKVYVTSLDRRITPIIRYFTGDVATPTDDECPCGRGLSLMKNVQGRIVDFILGEEDRYMSPWVVIRALRSIQGVENFKLTQKSDSSIDVQFRTRGLEAESVLNVLHQRCTELFGDMSLSIKLVDQIEGEGGPKFRPVASDLTH